MSSKIDSSIIKQVNEPGVWEIKDPSFCHLIKAEWAQPNNLLLIGSRPLKVTSEDKPSELAPCKSTIYEIHWNTQLYGEYTRNLINESLFIFQSLADTTKDNSNNLNRKYSKASLKYRSILSACVAEIKAAQESITNGLKEGFSQQANLFYMLELIWNFCELIFIDLQPGGTLMITLINWIQYHFNSVDKQIEQLFHFENPSDHISYWETILICILQGKITQARKLLKIHPHSSQDAFLCLEELLKKMPIFHPSTIMSLPEFGVRWYHWQAECESCLEDGIFLCYPHLEEICQLLCGKLEAFIKNKELCQNWYHFLVSLLFYTNPCIKAIDLQNKAKECIDIFGGKSQMSRFDFILLAAMEFDLENVIHQSCDLDDCWWFATHFTDLVYKKGHVKERIDSSLHEFIILNYANVLLSHPSLWQVGLEYLSYCHSLGKAHLEVFLEKIPLSSEAKAFKLLEIAKKNNLTNLSRGIAKIMGMKALQNNLLESAVSWAVRSQDLKLTSFLADKLLNEYCENNNISCLELLDNLGPCYLINEKLAFLAKYREFHQLYKNEELKDAASLLVSLITMKLAPKKFWPTLFLDAIPLLESTEPIFNNQQTYELLYAFEELTAYKPLALSQTEVEKQLDVNLFRIALTRNIARTFISESCSNENAT